MNLQGEIFYFFVYNISKSILKNTYFIISQFALRQSYEERITCGVNPKSVCQSLLNTDKNLFILVAKND